MRTLVISGGKEGVQRFEVRENEDYDLQKRAVEMSVELHNALNPKEEHWIWGEADTPSDPTLAKYV